MAFTLVLGGARSGKSAHAARAALASAEPGAAPVMIVTAQALDDEMTHRIALHRAERGDRWRTVEAPLDLAGAVAALAANQPAVIDCLTLWLTNVMLAGRDPEAEAEALTAALAACPARLWVVSNEVGWGLVPETPLGRRFRDEAGRLNQRLAARADRVELIVAGLPLALKPGV